MLKNHAVELQEKNTHTKSYDVLLNFIQFNNFMLNYIHSYPGPYAASSHKRIKPVCRTCYHTECCKQVSLHFRYISIRKVQWKWNINYQSWNNGSVVKRILVAPPEDPSSFPAPTSGSSHQPETLVSGDHTPSSGLWKLMNTCIICIRDTYIKKNKPSEKTALK